MVRDLISPSCWTLARFDQDVLGSMDLAFVAGIEGLLNQGNPRNIWRVQWEVNLIQAWVSYFGETIYAYIYLPLVITSPQVF